MINSQKNQKAKFSKPNTKLYLILTAIFGAAVITMFVLMCCNLGNASIPTITSAIISILGGALASVIVAWLIDISNCRLRNENLRQKEMKYLGYIAMFLDNLFQSFADICYRFDIEEPNSRAYRWEEWFKKLVRNSFFRDKEDFYKNMLTTYISLNHLISLISEMNSGELKDYIVHDSSLLSELLILHDTCQKIREYIFTRSAEIIPDEIVEHLVFSMNDVLSTIIPFYKLYNKEYLGQQNDVEER